MKSPIEIVTAFVAEWGKSREAMLASFHTYFTAETIWENVGLATTVGPHEAVAVLDSFEASLDVHLIPADLLAIAAVGDKVLTERIDWLCNAESGKREPLRVMGIFEIANGRIAAWRDYYDVAPFKLTAA